MSFPTPPEQPPGFPPAPAYGTAPPSGAPSGPLRGRTPRRLGWIFLGVAVVLFVVGGVVTGTKSLGKVNSFQRVTIADGGGSVQLDGTGKWVIYYEASNVTDSIDSLPRMLVVVTGPSGGRVTLQRYGNRSDNKIKKFTYDYNGHHGVAAFQFDAPKKGQYTIQAQAVDNLPANADLAVGRDIEKSTIVAGLLIGLGFLFLVAAIVLLIVGFVKRSRHKKELAAAPGSYGAPPPSGFGGPQGYSAPPPPPYGGTAPPPPYGGTAPPPPPGTWEQPS